MPAILRHIIYMSQSYFHWMMRPDSIFYNSLTNNDLNTENKIKINHISRINQVL